MVGGAAGYDPMLKITVLGIENGKVRLGFEAAADVPVHRMEVWERIRASVPNDSPNEDSNGHDWGSNSS